MKRGGQTLLLLSLIAAACLIAFERYRPENAITPRIVTPVSQTLSVPSSLRRIYPYSVIPGGAYNSAELRNAAMDDPLVHDHYRDFDLTRTRLVILRESRRQYVSYRMGSEIFWTKKRLLIPKGEVLLTDGTHYARTRCGNRLTDTAHKETSSFEPFSAAFELDPGRLEMKQAISQTRQIPNPRPDTREVESVVPEENARALLTSADRPALPVGVVSSPFSRDYITSSIVTPAIPLTNGKSPIPPVEVLLPVPAEPAVVPEPGTLYLFGFTGISSLGALLWLGRSRQK